MADRSKRPGGFAPLSEDMRVWEREQLLALGLDDVDWDPEVECPWCSQGRPHPTAKEETWEMGCAEIILLCAALETVMVALAADAVGRPPEAVSD
jgi:hypothetical protein